MADNEEKIEVSEPVQKTGTVQFMNSAGFSNPAPDKLKRVLTALRYFCVSLITMVSGTDLFTGAQCKVISFSLGVIIILLGAIEYATGVKELETPKP